MKWNVVLFRNEDSCGPRAGFDTVYVKRGRDPLQDFDGSGRFTTAFSEPDPVLSTWQRGGETQERLPDL